MLHELGIGAIVDDVLAEDRGGQDGVDFLSADVADLSVQDELVTVRAKAHRGLLAEKDEGENVSVLHEAHCIS